MCSLGVLQPSLPPSPTAVVCSLLEKAFISPLKPSTQALLVLSAMLLLITDIKQMEGVTQRPKRLEDVIKLPESDTAHFTVQWSLWAPSLNNMKFIKCNLSKYKGNHYTDRELPRGFPRGSVVKNPLAVQETGSIPGSGRSPGEGNGNPFQYSYLENPMLRGAWWVTVHRVRKE